MFLFELGENSNVSVKACRGKKVLNFETKALRGTTDGLIVDKIRYGNKVVSFDATKDISYMVTAASRSDNKVYRWGEVEIQKVYQEDGTFYHMLVSRQRAETINRRDSYRLYLGKNGVARAGAHKCAYEVVIKDISENGLAFIHPTDIDITKCGAVHITFKDSGLREDFNLLCVIVRKEPFEDQFIYGCRLLETDQPIAKYLAEKQREKISNKLKQL